MTFSQNMCVRGHCDGLATVTDSILVTSQTVKRLLVARAVLPLTVLGVHVFESPAVIMLPTTVAPE